MNRGRRTSRGPNIVRNSKVDLDIDGKRPVLAQFRATTDPKSGKTPLVSRPGAGRAGITHRPGAKCALSPARAVMVCLCAAICSLDLALSATRVMKCGFWTGRANLGRDEVLLPPRFRDKTRMARHPDFKTLMGPKTVCHVHPRKPASPSLRIGRSRVTSGTPAVRVRYRFSRFEHAGLPIKYHGLPF